MKLLLRDPSVAFSVAVPTDGNVFADMAAAALVADQLSLTGHACFEADHDALCRMEEQAGPGVFVGGDPAEEASFRGIPIRLVR